MKKMKNILLILLLILVTGCATDPSETLPTPAPASNENLLIRLGGSTLANTETPLDKEKAISSARVIVIGRTGGWMNRVSCNEKFTKDQLLGTDKNQIRVSVPSGLNDIYVVLNEYGNMTAQLDTVKTRQGFKIVSAPFISQGVGAVELSMLEKFENKTIPPYPAQTTLTGTGAERLCTKVRVNFKTVSGSGPIGIPDLSGMVINEIEFSNCAPFGYMLPKIYTGTDYKTKLNSSGITVNASTWTKGTEIYLPEHLVNTAASPARYTSISIKGTLVGGQKCSYKVDMNYDLVRNTIYEINCTVKGRGEEMLTVVTNVLPWSNETTTPEVGNVLKSSCAEYIVLERPNLKIAYVTIATVSNNIPGADGNTAHKDVVTATGTGLSLQGAVSGQFGNIVAPDAADLTIPTTDKPLAEKDIIVNLDEGFTAGTVNINIGNKFRQEIKVVRAPFQASGEWERFDLGTRFTYIPASANNAYMKVSTETTWSSAMSTVSGAVSAAAHLYVYVKRTVDSGRVGVGFNAERQTNDALQTRYQVRCSYALPRMGNLIIARRDLIGRISWAIAMGRDISANNALVGSTMGANMTGCNTLGAGWRVPTQTELELTWAKRDSLVKQCVSFLGDFFWTSTEERANQARIVSFYDTNKIPYSKNPTGGLSVRCVKDL